MSAYNSPQELVDAWPGTAEAMQCIFVSEMGEIHQYVMRVEDWHREMSTLMTSYVFVNGWKSIVHAIEL